MYALVHRAIFISVVGTSEPYPTRFPETHPNKLLVCSRGVDFDKVISATFLLESANQNEWWCGKRYWNQSLHPRPNMGFFLDRYESLAWLVSVLVHNLWGRQCFRRRFSCSLPLHMEASGSLTLSKRGWQCLLRTLEHDLDFEILQKTYHNPDYCYLRSLIMIYPLKDNASPTGLVLFGENLVQNFYSIAPNWVFRMPNRAP